MLDFQKIRINTDLLASSGTARHKQDLRIENLKPCSRGVRFAPCPKKARFSIISLLIQNMGTSKSSINKTWVENSDGGKPPLCSQFLRV